MGPKLLLMVTIGMLAACEAQIGDKADEPETAAVGGNAAEPAADGQFSIDAPGFKMKLDIPKNLADRAEVDSDNGLLYPGSKLSGLHVKAGKEKADTDRVELRFNSKDAIDTVVAWYRDPARAGDFTLGSAAANSGGWLITGTEKDDGDTFELQLNPRGGGGTDGVLRLADRA